MDHDIGLDMETIFQVVLFVVGIMSVMQEPRNPSLYEQRIAFDSYSERHEQRNTFKRRLRMSKSSFDKLLSFIKEDLMVNETKANMRGGSILPEVCLFCTLRWLAGGSYLDICDITGISRGSFYRVLWKTIFAICRAKELELRWPESQFELQQVVYKTH